MSVYFFVWFAVALIAVLGRNKKTIGGKDGDTVFFLFLVLFLLSALRYDVGVDYLSYMRIYYSDNPDRSEPGFNFLNVLFRNKGFSFQSIVILYGFVTIFFAFAYFKENSKNIYLSVLIFYCFTPLYLNSFNQLRQATAMYVFLWATRYIKQRKLLKFVLITAVTAFFAHFSVVVLLPLYFFDKRISFKLGVFLFVAALIGYRFLDIVIEMLGYGFYIRYAMVFQKTGKRFPPVYFVELCFDILILLFYRAKGEKHFVEKNMVFAHFVLLFLLIMDPLSIVREALGRVLYYFLPVQIVLLPNMFVELKKLRLLGNYFCMACFSMYLFLSVSIRGQSTNIVPYQTFFGKF